MKKVITEVVSSSYGRGASILLSKLLSTCHTCVNIAITVHKHIWVPTMKRTSLFSIDYK